MTAETVVYKTDAPDHPPDVKEFLASREQKSYKGRGEGSGIAGDGSTEDSLTALPRDDQPDAKYRTGRSGSPDNAKGAERKDRRRSKRADPEGCKSTHYEWERS